MSETTHLIKSTPFKAIHEQLGAKMLPFAGYLMPITYAGVAAEHENVRKNVGVFDVSHMGEFILRGRHAIDLIQYVTSNDAAALFDGKVQYSCLPNDKGGIVDDLLVYRINAETYMLVVNASNIEKDWEWIKKHDRWGVDMVNISDETALLAVQGPHAAKALQSLTDLPLAEMEYYTFKKGTFAGVSNVLVSATGYTGAGGFELYFKSEHAENLWHAIMEAGSALGIKPAGLAARDTLRLEMGFCLYGNDINEQTSPIEAGLGWITKFNKDFINKAHLLDQKENGVTRKLVGFTMQEKGVARQHYPVLNAAGEPIGEVTSGTKTPSLDQPIGLAYVSAAHAKAGSEIFIQVRDKSLKALVTKLPFYKNA